MQLYVVWTRPTGRLHHPIHAEFSVLSQRASRIAGTLPCLMHLAIFHVDENTHIPSRGCNDNVSSLGHLVFETVSLVHITM